VTLTPIIARLSLIHCLHRSKNYSWQYISITVAFAGPRVNIRVSIRILLYISLPSWMSSAPFGSQVGLSSYIPLQSCITTVIAHQQLCKYHCDTSILSTHPPQCRPRPLPRRNGSRALDMRPHRRARSRDTHLRQNEHKTRAKARRPPYPAHAAPLLHRPHNRLTRHVSHHPEHHQQRTNQHKRVSQTSDHTPRARCKP
jgi:hypothetical protein